MCVCLLYADARCWDAVSFLSASLTARMLIITAPTVSRHWRMCPDSSDNVTAESAIHYILQQWILNICGSVSISCLYQWERSDSYSITVSSCSFLARFVWCHCCYCSCVCLSVCLSLTLVDLVKAIQNSNTRFAHTVIVQVFVAKIHGCWFKSSVYRGRGH